MTTTTTDCNEMTPSMVRAAIMPTLRAKNALPASRMRDIIEGKISQSLTALNHGRVHCAAILADDAASLLATVTR